MRNEASVRRGGAVSGEESANDVLAPVLRAAPRAGEVVAGLVRDGRPSVRYRGTAGLLDSDSRFEIGSITKTFTALLLAEMAADGLVSYDDPINRYLPSRARRTGPEITLLHLATHTSGLPRLPPGMLRRALPQMFSNPYEKFTVDDLLASVPRARLRRRPGKRVHYSNFGVGLLGQLLARAAGMDARYEDVLDARVLTPLGLTGTDGDPSRPQVTGHWHGRPRPPWRIPGLAGAGALRSTARDLLGYLSALLDPDTVPESALRAALGDILCPRDVVRRGDPRLLVWFRAEYPGYDVVHHSGGTRGFTSFVGFSPQARCGLVAMAGVSPSVRGTFIQAGYDALVALSARYAVIRAGEGRSSNTSAVEET